MLCGIEPKKKKKKCQWKRTKKKFAILELCHNSLVLLKYIKKKEAPDQHTESKVYYAPHFFSVCLSFSLSHHLLYEYVVYLYFLLPLFCFSFFFILCTVEEAKLLSIIVSYCQRISASMRMYWNIVLSTHKLLPIKITTFVLGASSTHTYVSLLLAPLYYTYVVQYL